MRALCKKHSQGQKVKGQGHKVMRRSSTRTSNISSNYTSLATLGSGNASAL